MDITSVKNRADICGEDEISSVQSAKQDRNFVTQSYFKFRLSEKVENTTGYSMKLNQIATDSCDGKLTG